MRSRRRVFLLLTALYFSQGLPFGFFVQALPVVLRTRGYALEAIGLTALLALPWALKFLWAPLVDRWATRRRWILVMQASMTALLVALALFGVGAPPLAAIMVGVFFTNLFAATQDIATDGLAVRLLPEADRGLANGVQVAAYRLGMIVGGGAILAAFATLGWAGTFALMAGLITAAALLVLRWAPDVRDTSTERPQRPLRGFLARPGARRLLLGLLVFKAGEAAATSMLRPWLVDLGLRLEDIGGLLGGAGFGAGLLGALLGGWVTGRGSRRPVLVAFGVLQALVVAAYAALATGTPTLVTLYLVVSAEHLVAGLATAALFTTMMDRCRPAAASTDYTAQASAVVVATGAAAALAGYGAANLGYAGHFAMCALFAALAPLVVPWLAPSETSLAEQEGEPTMRRAVYAGTFDPVTVGHLAVIEAARRVFDEVIVLIAHNPAKTTLFDLDERRAQLADALAERTGVRIDSTEGLVAAYARAHDVHALVRGLRAGAEADYELDLARANRTVAPELETVILPAPAELTAVSSSLLKQMARAGLDGARLCPAGVWRALKARLAPTGCPQ